MKPHRWKKEVIVVQLLSSVWLCNPMDWEHIRLTCPSLSTLRIRWPEYWSIGTSASLFSVNIQGRFPLRLLGLIYLQSKRFSRVFSSTTVLTHQFFLRSAFFMVQLSHLWMTTGKKQNFDYRSAEWCLCFLIWCLCLS